MGWENRSYYRDRSYPQGNVLGWFLTGSVPLFTVFGVRVRMHASMIIFIGLQLLLAGTRGGLGAANAVTAMSILFLSVLLHEFGHCFGARWMGGSADDVLMWPLGGLAYTHPPARPWPRLVTTVCGPLVNFLICVVTGLALVVLSSSPDAIPWFPVRDGIRSYVPHDWTTYYIWWVFLVNYALLIFNLLLVFYPFDGGRIIQELLWMKVGYAKSMKFATITGMVGAVVVAAIGLAYWSFLLVLIAGFGFFTCRRQWQLLREAGPEAADPVDYGSSHVDRPRKRISRWSAKRAEKEAAREVSEQKKIDAILAKVSAQGMNSLTYFEKKALRRATERQRQRDQADEARLRRAWQ